MKPLELSLSSPFRASFSLLRYEFSLLFVLSLAYSSVLYYFSIVSFSAYDLVVLVKFSPIARSLSTFVVSRIFSCTERASLRFVSTVPARRLSRSAIRMSVRLALAKF